MRTMKDYLVGHISRDATVIAGRDKPVPKAPDARRRKRQLGLSAIVRATVQGPTRLQRQLAMTLPQMLYKLCDVGVRANAIHARQGITGCCWRFKESAVRQITVCY